MYFPKKHALQMTRISLPPVLCLVLTHPAMLCAGTKVQIDSVSPEYTPIGAGPGRPEPVSIESYSFEVNKETGRARIVVEYTYPDRPNFGLDGGSGPQPTFAQLPGLTYDLASNSVVYVGDGRRTVCATIQTEKVLLWKKPIVKSTGACLVTSRSVDEAKDDGWRIHRYRSMAVFFEAP